MYSIQVQAENSDGTSIGIEYLLRSVSNGGDNYFSVDGITGDVKVISPNIDAELVTEYTLFVEAQDVRGSPIL